MSSLDVVQRQNSHVVHQQLLIFTETERRCREFSQVQVVPVVQVLTGSGCHPRTDDELREFPETESISIITY